MSVSELAPLAGTVLAAAAAGASWASVYQARKALNAGVLPQLHVEGYAVGRLSGVRGESQGGEPRHLVYSVHNSGGGIARRVGVLLVCQQQYIAGFVGLGVIRPGESFVLRTPMRVPQETLQPPMEGVITGADARDVTHIWDTRGARKPKRVRPSRRAKEPPSLADLFHRFYPDVDLKRLEQKGFSVELSNRGGM